MSVIYVQKGTTNLSGTYTIASGDTVVFNEGTQTINAGADLSGIAAGAVTEIFISPRATVGFDPTTPLKVNATSLYYSAGGGSWYVQAAGNSNVITTLTHAGKGNMYLVGGGTFTSYEQLSGYGKIADVVVVTTVRMSGGTCDQLYSASANTNWFIDGGTFNTGRGFSGSASYIMGGAHVNVFREDTSATLPTGGTIVVADGRLKWGGGNCTSIVLGSNGMLDLSEAPNAATIAVEGTAKALARSKLASKYAALTVNVTERCGSRTSLYAASPDSLAI